LNSACSAKGNISQVAQQSLYTQNGSEHSIGDAGDLLDSIYTQIRINDSKSTLIIFIHGRGNHPAKAFEQELITNLEIDNNARVIMFHWPSSGAFYNYPEKAARRAAHDFAKVLKAISNIKSRVDEPPRLVLLAHSLGSYVLEETLLGYSDEFDEPLFDTALLSSPASRSSDHAIWVEKFHIANNIYITSNNRDPVLKAAGFRKLAKRLGKSLTNNSGNYFDLATNARYLELSNLELGHRYYLKKNTSSLPTFQQVLTNILSGKNPDLSQIRTAGGANSNVHIFSN